MKRFLSDSEAKGTVLTNLWNDLDTNTNATKHSQKLFEGKSFTNPKPEDLISRIINLSTKPGDIVLDSFLGSGTTAAVAHKMNRIWIGVEMGDQCYDFCKVRIDKVINNEDDGGITTNVGWKGGGGYKFYELAPTLISEDTFGEPVINKYYNYEMLSRAVALHEGFEYNPDKEIFWKQSIGNENSYLYVTTQFLNSITLDKIKETMLSEEYLVIACTAYDEALLNKYKNIMIKKIPEMLLNKCKFNVNNYNLNVINDISSNMEDESYE